jgi:acyl carrier protein
MAERTGLAPITDETHTCDCLYTADCPPVGAALTVPIPVVRIAYGSAPTLVRDAVLLLPGVTDCVVHLLPLRGHPRAVAVFLSPAGAQTEAVTQQLTGVLPVYFLPALVCPLAASALPATRDAAITLASAALTQKSIAVLVGSGKRSEMEDRLMAIFRKCLNSDSLDADTSFFDAGGDSLKAGQLASAIRKACAVQLTVTDVFTHPSVTAMAKRLAAINPQKGQGRSMSPRHGLGQSFSPHQGLHLLQLSRQGLTAHQSSWC